MKHLLLTTLSIAAILSVTCAKPLCAEDAPVRVEKWADNRLTVTNELELWLDATRVNGTELVPHDGKIAKWFDASGQQRHFQQPVADAQPVRLPVGETAIVRFDGVDDFLRQTQSHLERDRLSVFIVASPRKNPGGFRAVLATNETEQRDYESGMTVDFGPMATSRFSVLNVEGRGFGTWKNLLTAERPFRELNVFEIVADSKSVRLNLDGIPAGERPRDGGPISLSEITVGARYYTLGGGPQQVQGFGSWDIAEILIYGRSLTTDETQQLHKYFDEKYKGIQEQLPADADGDIAMLEPIEDPPPIQTLLPGFSVNELPVELTNINNLLYRPDGTLFALAYNGIIWKLRDTDGDGLEDHAEVFLDSKGNLKSPIGMDLTPPGYPQGDGVFVVGKTRCVLIVDTDQDGIADKEIPVVEGWKESFHQVDGLGVAFDKRDGSVYFGRGTYNFADPLLRNKEGVPQYKLTDEAGAIIRVSPDFKTREVVATGIRFPVGLRFDRYGELFATDQEGATWVPNGNPLDELLHIQKGRHYGFPPRHPEHLPDVIDEPSLFDFGPQHQSTCGFAFNDPIGEHGQIFGPQAWDGDAFITGQSRGKIYRTRVIRTPVGLVAQSQLFACLSMLTVDCCVAQDGSLRVACHSGGPDWGSGPTGQGKLFRIRYDDPQHPQPVVVWPNGTNEVRVEFDRAVDPRLLRDTLRQASLTAGRYVRAGDRFETIFPGYAIVQGQKIAPRVDIPIRSVQLTPDNRTLVLATDRHSAAIHYGLTLPAMGRPMRGESTGTARPQVPEIDLDFDLTGCEATWVPKVGTVAGAATWTGWLPHPDLTVSRALTKGSATHDVLWQAMQDAGELTLRTQLDLSKMLRPAVQPGSRLNLEFPAEVVTVTFEASAPLSLVAEIRNPPVNGNAAQNIVLTEADTLTTETQSSFRIEPPQNSPVLIELRITSPGGELALNSQFSTAEDPRIRSLPVRRFLLPWSESNPGELYQEPAVVTAPELEGGSWARGRALFYGEVAVCSKCHSVHGRGGQLGPDLSNLIHRDYHSVLRDITSPSFAINPDHLSYTVALQDGRTLSGVVRTVGDKVQVGNLQGMVTEVPKSDVDEMRPTSISTMPEGIPKLLGPDRLRDLLTFLLTRSPGMPDYGAGEPPLPPTRNEVSALLAGAPDPAEKTRNLSVILVSGRKDHGPGEHDYPAWQKAWSELLGIAENASVGVADSWPSPEQLRTADVLVFYQQGTWTSERADDMDAFLNRGGGAVYIHYAVDGGMDAPGFAQRIGLAWQGGKSRFRHGPLDLGFDTGVNHPIGRNFETLSLHDESYWQLAGDPKEITNLAVGIEDGKPQPLFWTLEPSQGRVVVSIPGHYAWTFDDPRFRILILRGIAWAAREPVDRFNDLVLPGARIRD
jgi:putative heme-binding domain-containing protein